MTAWILAPHANAAQSGQELLIPEVMQGSRRLITTDDMAALRWIERLEVSPDKHRYAIFVRQGDPAANVYRGGWFVGAVQGGKLTYVGDAGELQLDGNGGSIEVPDVRWSPDSQWVAYTLRNGGEVQLWRSKVDGSLQEQITRNAADVREFSWTEDGRALYFTVGASRSELDAYDKAKDRAGYQYDVDLLGYAEFLNPVSPRHSGPSVATSSSIWVVTLKERQERLGSEPERSAFELARGRSAGARDSVKDAVDNVVVPPVESGDGALAWLVRSKAFSLHSRLMAALPSSGSKQIACVATECSGRINLVWWSEDSQRVLFLRKDGIGDGPYGGSGGRGIYAWSPSSGALSTVLYTLDYFQQCSPAWGGRLICIRETPTRPQHVASINVRSGAAQAASIQVVADVNPEFRNIRLGRAERLEWDTPKFSWNEPGGPLLNVYPTRAFGYILYPPDFDPTRKYPVVIEPYMANGGFTHSGAHLEQPLHVYAANGLVVLNAQFPISNENTAALLGSASMRLRYSAELDFPQMSMFMESTVKGLKVAVAKGFIDERLVGIGGMSTGSFIPLYMLQKHDLIAAISISNMNWVASNCYTPTLKGRESARMSEWTPRPDCERQEFWSRIDIADHVDAIEAPILMNLSASETSGMARLLRHLADASKPYDAYVFPRETHTKWQPAHLYAIQNRNLDWFRFWLQGHEDPSRSKVEQYARWHRLRAQHETNRARAGRGAE